MDKEFPLLDTTKAWQKVEKHLIGAIAGVNVSYAGKETLRNRPPNSLVTDDEVKASGQDYLKELAKAPLYAELRKGALKY